MAKKAEIETPVSLNIRPLGDRVLIEAADDDETTFAGGKLVLPETAKEKPQKGTILAAGAGRKDDTGKVIPLDVEVGQSVLYAKYAGTEVKLNGKKYLILKETDILAIVE
jgi:chaperonin GroES